MLAGHSVVIKLWDTEKAGDQEVHFYRGFKDCSVRIPDCLHAEIDTRRNRGVLLLEDLSHCLQGDVLTLLDQRQSINLADQLASLHAQYLLDKRLTSYRWLNDWSDGPRTVDWVQSRRKRFLNRFPGLLSGFPLDLLHRLEKAYTHSHQRLIDLPRTLIHGDFHLDNILFENNSEPILLDWSRPLKGPFVINLATLLFEMAELDNFDLVLDIYLEKLNASGIMTLESSNVQTQLTDALIQRFLAATCGVALWEPTLPRAKKIIPFVANKLADAVNFWHDRYPDEFAFLFSEK